MTDYAINQKVVDFLPRIYDAVTNFTAWPVLLDDFTEFCDADASSLLLGDMVNPEIRLLPTSQQLTKFDAVYYRENFGHEDAIAISNMKNRPVFEWVSEEDAFGQPATSIGGTRYMMEHVGLERRYAARLTNSRIWTDAVSLNYRTGQHRFSEQLCQISDVILPHFAKAIEISRPFVLLDQRFGAVLAVLDKFHVGVVIVTPSGQIVVENQAAARILDRKDGFSAGRDRQLRLVDPDLHAEMTSVITQAVKHHGQKLSVPPIAIEKSSSNSRYLLDIAPLSEFDGNIGGRFRGAVLFITDPDRHDIISTRSMGALFDLTPAEAQVAAHLAEGHSSENIADIRHTSVSTIKSQIRALFAKTGVNNRTELARLAMKIDLPVDHAPASKP